MHYILLSIALNLGKEDISLVKLKDLHNPNPTVIQLAQTEPETLPVLDVNEDNSAPESSFNDDNTDFAIPYIESDSFGDLLPEDETGNAITSQEEQGPKFLDSVKNKLIEVTQGNTTADNKVAVPSTIDNAKEKISDNNKEKKSDNLVADKTQTVTKTEDADNTNLFDKIQNKISTADIKEGANKIVETIKGTTTDITNKITSKDEQIAAVPKEIPDQSNKNNIADERKVKIVGNLFDSELNQAKKDEEKLKPEDEVVVKDNLAYQEDENFEKFLKEKEPKDLSNPEKILIPSIQPKKKDYATYDTQKVPQELLDARSFQNRHIPAIMQNKEKQELLEKIIAYGMVEELRAFMKDNLRDANVIMDNQYTLLTYATQNKQYDVMKFLIRQGADVNKRDENLETPLLIAVNNNDLEGVKVLTESNVNLEKIDVLRRTPLILAIEKNYDKIALYLIDNGANIDAKNAIGEGTLAMTTRLGKIQVREKILSILRQDPNNTIVKNEEAISDKNTARN